MSVKKPISAIVKEKFNNVIDEMAAAPSLWVKDPQRDFTRNTLMNFKNTMTAVFHMGGQSLDKELFTFMKDTGRTVSASAFVQQRGKILPEAFEYAFHEFNEQTEYLDKQTYDGYKVYAVDGSDICFATDPLSETYMKSGNYNMYHMNAMQDVLNNTYKDLIIEPKPSYSEPRSCWQMVERSLKGEKCIVLCDRGYGGANLFEHINRCENVEYLIRVKNDLFKEFKCMPNGEFDETIVFHLRTTQTNEDKIAYARGEAKWISGNSKFGKYKKSKTWDFEPRFDLAVRCVRIRINEYGHKDEYYTLCTSLPKDKFPPEKIKELYRLRWGIETSFRELKYAIGLINFHARKEESVKQEIYAHFMLYNYCERIAMHVVIKQDKGNKWIYAINHSDAVYILIDYLRDKTNRPPPVNIEAELQKHIVPIRDNRRDRRKIRPKTAVCFLYRVA